jgi:hypothetical protein
MGKIHAMISETHIRQETAHKLARYALFSFLVTFILARVFVFLIMSGKCRTFIFSCTGRMCIT